MEKGKLIVVEGACDGIGKSTQIDLIKKRLISDGEIITTHHFPTYDTPQGMLAQMYLNGDFGSPKEMSPYLINSFYAIDRAVTWRMKLKVAYERGDVIMLDRYTSSSIIYQAQALPDIEERKAFIDYMCDFEYNKLGIQEPDNIIFLTAPFDLVTEMRSKRTDNDGIVNDIHERNIEYMREVYDNANFVAKYLGWDIIDCSNGDEMRSREDIHEEIYRLIRKKNL